MCKVLYKIDKFTDYAGEEREFVLAAVSIEEARSCETDDEVEGMRADQEIVDTVKTLSIGIAVRRPSDTNNLEFAKKIAYGKAIAYRRTALMSTDTGLINTTVVNAVLEQEAEFFKRNPGRYLAGYDKDAETYRWKKEVNEKYNNMSAEEKAAIKLISNMSDAALDNFCDVLDSVDDLDARV